MGECKIADRINAIESRVLTDEARYERGEYSSIAEVGVPSARDAMLIGNGYLTLGECSRAQVWYDDSADGWTWKFETAIDMALDKGDTISGVKWRHGHKVLRTALLSGSEERLSETCATVMEVLDTIPEDLRGNASHFHFCHALIAFSADALSIDQEVGLPKHRVIEWLAEDADDSEELSEVFYRSYHTVLSGITSGDVSQIERGIERLTEYHEPVYVEDPYTDLSNDPNAVLEHCLALDACTAMVLARLHGFDPTVESEYLPSSISDAECYPIGSLESP
ncbi:hypothetical protein [Natrinema sp. 74]|uniref:hypothetical protein n=1 Tax=Natrinema sp. 74 TaxID=3384159 RepID=UPI0038D3EA46